MCLELCLILFSKPSVQNNQIHYFLTVFITSFAPCFTMLYHSTSLVKIESVFVTAIPSFVLPFFSLYFELFSLRQFFLYFISRNICCLFSNFWEKISSLSFSSSYSFNFKLENITPICLHSYITLTRGT
uniref:Uncharacterized protein n=1 Tax=Cacopsylla melanoneura TaxID=428564 RepID=A0A8D8YY59_9HEMI